MKVMLTLFGIEQIALKGFTDDSQYYSPFARMPPVSFRRFADVWPCGSRVAVRK